MDSDEKIETLPHVGICSVYLNCLEDLGLKFGLWIILFLLIVQIWTAAGNVFQSVSGSVLAAKSKPLPVQLFNTCK